MASDQAISLNNHTLGALPVQIARPTYDRTALRPGIVHIGLGNFHRAHQAWYLHRLMQAGKALDWAIIGAGVRPADSAMRERLLAQDCLTTLIELDPAGTTAEVIGSMIDFVPIEDGHGPLIRQMTAPEIRIVSLTVTEGGYYRDPATCAFDRSHPDIVHDAANPDRPRTAFGAVLSALSARFDADLPPFTLLCCDNLQGNGDILRDTVMGLARLISPGLAQRVARDVCFPNSMVDCIVPATGAAEIARARDLGIDDAAPVTHENFRQWVIEDAFGAGRPPWEEAGATFTDDVHAFEAMKIRILNGGHQVLANAGELLGLPTIAACMQDPAVEPFFHKVQRQEIVPYVGAVPGMQPGAYLDLIAQRFSNPEIHDTVRRVAFDGSSRHTGFILPVLRDALASGGEIEGLALVEALWARMCAGIRDDGSVIEANDPHWSALQPAARTARHTPASWLSQAHIYGDLGHDPRFQAAFADSLARLWADGTRATLERYLTGV